MEKELHEFSLRMQRLIPKLRCDSDKTWRPENVSDGTGGTSPTGIQGGGGDNALIPQNAAKISMVVFGTIAIVVGGSIFLRHRAKVRRRRARRLPCALNCTVSFLQDKRKGIPQTARRGRMCDISQLGAKVCVDDDTPETLNDCNLYSHGWSTRGHVIWRNAQCMGIAFKRRLPAQDLYRLVRLNRKLHSGKKNGTP
ncbi:MAG: PilZ domain-containing protein [Thalassovita sp.]